MITRFAVLAFLSGASMMGMLGCAQQSPPSAPRFAVYVASDQETAQYFMPRMTPDGRSVFIASDPLLTEHDVANVDTGEFAGVQPMLTLDLTDAGTHRLKRHADEYVGREFVVVWDHEVVSTPRIMNPLSNQIAIVASETLTTREIQAMIEYFSETQLAAMNNS